MVHEITKKAYVTERGREFDLIEDAERSESIDALEDLIDKFHYRGMGTREIAEHLLEQHVLELEIILNQYKVK